MSKSVDWIVSSFLVLVGSTFAIGGVLLSRLADVDQITAWVAAGRITSTEMTDAELIDAVYALLWGGGIGIAVTGALLAVAGVAFLALQSRARRRFEETGAVEPSATSNAILGAIVSVVASFVPFSPVLGGALAGYLQSGAEDGAVRAGSLAGLFASIPVVVVFAAITWTLLGTTSGVTALVVVVLGMSLAVAVAYVMGLSALGGYLGRWFAKERHWA